MPKTPKKWTLMIWMAGDNDLQDFGESDLKELKKVGSTDDIDVVVQFDRMTDDHTRRYHLRAGTSLDADQVQELGETNTGDPGVAIDFFTWGIQQCPADRYLAVLWNHGSGIDETDIYRRAAALGMSVERRARRSSTTLPRGVARELSTRTFRRALFAPTVDAAMQRRGILYDDTSRDFLDNIELKKVLVEVKRAAGQKIDLLGFDACLMNMVEVAFQVRQGAGFVVGSEEVEPGEGWPYDKILADLAAKPAMTPPELGAVIVKRYIASYTGEQVTQSLVSLDRAAALGRAVSVLADHLIAAIKTPAEYAAVTKSILRAQRYSSKDFIDLYDLCEQFKQLVKSAKVKAAAEETIQALAGASPFVLAEKHKGATVARSHGVAIYFPRGDTSVAYDRLDFAKEARWDDFISAYQR